MDESLHRFLYLQTPVFYLQKIMFYQYSSNNFLYAGFFPSFATAHNCLSRFMDSPFLLDAAEMTSSYFCLVKNIVTDSIFLIKGIYSNLDQTVLIGFNSQKGTVSVKVVQFQALKSGL